MQIDVDVNMGDAATMVLLCRRKLSTLLDRYRAIIIELVQPYAAFPVTETVSRRIRMAVARYYRNVQ